MFTLTLVSYSYWGSTTRRTHKSFTIIFIKKTYVRSSEIFFRLPSNDGEGGGETRVGYPVTRFLSPPLPFIRDKDLKGQSYEIVDPHSYLLQYKLSLTHCINRQKQGSKNLVGGFHYRECYILFSTNRLLYFFSKCFRLKLYL